MKKRKMDIRVKAVRDDEYIGTDTLSVADECMTDDEIVTWLNGVKISDPAEAVEYFKAIEQTHQTWAGSKS